VARITREPLDLQAEAALVARPAAGALLTFSGVVREEHLGRRVVGIEYHAYEPMALQEMARIEEEARRRWPGAAVAMAHRLGTLKVGEASIVIAVSSPHRAEGFAALRFAIDTLKETVPIWKKELYEDGYAWIEGS
jgi:molybdopterin synthase catalytic subunit